MTSKPEESTPFNPFFSEKTQVPIADGYNKLHIPSSDVPDSANGFDALLEDLVDCRPAERDAIEQAGEFIRWSANLAGITEWKAIKHRLNRRGGLTLVFSSDGEINPPRDG